MNDEIMIQESAAALAFSRQANEFDSLYGNDPIIRYKRDRVRAVVEEFLQPNSNILELNAGTGEDAIYFAGLGHRVHATDISGSMLGILDQKVAAKKLQHVITHETCSFTKLDQLNDPGPFDLIFSNFAGLNCTKELGKVLHSFNFLLKPGGLVTVVLLPKFCLWEFLLLFRGKFKTAFRRFSGKKGTRAKINDAEFRCWYYNPSFIRKQLKDSFEVVSLEGLCTIVPPSYMEGFSEKHPRLYRSLVKHEDQWKRRWPWKLLGDYYVLTMRRK